MRNKTVILLGLFTILAMSALPVLSNESSPLVLERSGSYEYIRGLDADTIFITDSVLFTIGDAVIMAERAVWIKGQSIILERDVYIEDSLHQLWADQVTYDIMENASRAVGEEVVLVSLTDSIKAVGTNAWFDRDNGLFRMQDRPVMYLHYQDSARLVQINADQLVYDGDARIGYADGQVVIRQSEAESHSGRAIMYTDDNVMLLLDGPHTRRKESEISGDTLIFYSNDQTLERISVQGNAVGDFTEPNQRDSTQNDKFDLTGADLEFHFADGDLNRVRAANQAYSYYAPAPGDSSEVIENYASGDTITFFLENENLTAVNVIGGAEGEYLSGKKKETDSGSVFTVDSVQYSGSMIDYQLADSSITLSEAARVSSGDMSLSAATIDYLTARQLVKAYDDSAVVDSHFVYVPVILNDGSDELFGSYLEYSLDTERGLLRQAKSEYQEAYYRGKDLYRHEEEVFYVEGGMYTSCNLDKPHFHFWSKHMKMIRGERIIVRPVVFYIEKVPILIFPYYVFPIKPGRHSGFLPFKFGNFEQGDRYLENVGYYWAASQYWDGKAWLNYYEDYGLKFNGDIRYNVRYLLSGHVSGSYTTDTEYSNYQKQKDVRWNINFNHDQTISPTFSLKAYGNFVSDKSFYTDFSNDQEDRLNRNLRSQLSLSKKFGNASLSAQFIHNEALDDESRTDNFPTASISFPSRALFGSPGKDADGNQKRYFYHNIYTSYRVNVNNYSSRSTLDDGTRTRKEYLTVSHSTGLSMSFSLLQYLKLGFSVPYQETWYKVFETDQSLDAGIDASEVYRRYAYSASVNASTDLYGTVSPRLAGLEAFRHVLTPSVGFSWSPKITKNDMLKSYTGAGGGSSAESKSMTFSLRQLFQAKVKAGEQTKTLDLLTLNSSLSHNFEAEERKFSNLTTTAQTNLLKYITLTGSMTHDLYEPNTDKLHWWSPYLLSLSVRSSFSTSGSFGRYKTATPCNGPDCDEHDFENSEQSWRFSVSHQYSEYGRGSSFRKTHAVNFSGEIEPTPNLKIKYSQYYDIADHKTISRRIEITRKLHCWEGAFYWVPDGSNKGYYFRVNVIQIPDIKFEKSESGVRGAFF